MPPTASRWHRTCFSEVWTLAGCSSSRSRCGLRRRRGTPRVHGAGSAPSCPPSPFSQTQEGGRPWSRGRSRSHSPGHSVYRPYQDPVGGLIIYNYIKIQPYLDVCLKDEVSETPQRRAGFKLQHVISISHRGVFSLFSVFPDVRPLYLKVPTAQTSRPQSLRATKLWTLPQGNKKSPYSDHAGVSFLFIWYSDLTPTRPHQGPPVCDCMNDGAPRSSVLVTGGFLVPVNYCHIAPCVCSSV